MSQKALEQFKAYQFAMELFDFVVNDMELIGQRFELQRLVSQQLASADSICANIEESHGRETTGDYTHFLIIARGSTRETRGRYIRMKKWLSEDIIKDRVSRCDSIIAILSKTITTLRRIGSK
jgi:four helix bundle protein